MLTHDFVHRTHIEIFDMEYYPPEFTDWWLDNWITEVYKSERTRQVRAIQVKHHMGHHGTRYEVETWRGNLLTFVVDKKRQKVVDWMERHGASAEEIEIYKNDTHKFPIKDIVR